MNEIEKWYRRMGNQQKVFVYLVSIGLIFAFGFGLLPLAILIYLELGDRNNNRLR
tara:strand:+ start:32 stop:196 length:165 start_codon:yes stop_codon:yes gene_type:complete